MSSGSFLRCRAPAIAVLAVLCLMLMSSSSPVASANVVTTTHFTSGTDNVTVTFKDVATNATMGIDVPRGATIESASMDVEGLFGYSDDLRTLDFKGWDSQSPHLASAGTVQGNYPPTYPYWDPVDLEDPGLAMQDYLRIGTSDDDRISTITGVGATQIYPFHVFRFVVPVGIVTDLFIRWEGYGYCDVSTHPGGANLFMWKNMSETWSRSAFYGHTGSPRDRLLDKGWSANAEDFIDSKRQVYALVVGMPSMLDGGPNPVTKPGELHTDFIYLNVTLQGDREDPEGLSLAIQPMGTFWEIDGAFTGKATLDASSRLGQAIQRAVDDATVLPGNVTVPIEVGLEAVSSARVRLSNLTVTYTPVVNRGPSWSTIPFQTMLEDEDAIGLVDLWRFTDDDWSNTSLAFTVVDSSTDAIEAVVEDDRNLSFYVREPNWYGRATFQVNATDPWGLNATSPTIVVDVIEVNDPPQVVNPGVLDGTQGVPFYYQVGAVDVDGDAIIFSLDTTAFDIRPLDGVIDFTPNNEQVGLHRVTVTVTDARGGETQVWMELLIANVNDPPVIEGPSTLMARQREYFNHTFQVNDPDSIHGDQLTWSLEGDVAYLEVLELHPILGELIWRSPGNDDVGHHSFTVRVIDSGRASDELDFIIVVENVNDPPRIAFFEDLVVFEDRVVSHTLHASDPDMDVDAEETLTWTVQPPMFQVGDDGTFTFAALADHIGQHNVTVTVTDRAGASHSITFMLTVKGLNHPPVIGSIPDQTVLEDEAWSLEITVSDQDPGDEVQLGARGAPFHVPPSGGLILWTPQERHGGEYLITLTALDSRGAFTVLTFNLTVVTRNDPPTVEIRSPKPDAVVPGGADVFLSSIGQDEEGDHMTFTWWWRYEDSPDSKWEKITTGPSHSWTDPPAGRILVRVEVTDGEGTSQDEVAIRVQAEEEDDGSSMTLVVGGLVIAILVLLVLLLARTGRLGGREEEPTEETEEERWEPVSEDDYRSRVHR